MSIFLCASAICNKQKERRSFYPQKLFYFDIKTAVGTTKWVDIKYKLMQPNLPVRQNCSAVFLCFFLDFFAHLLETFVGATVYGQCTEFRLQLNAYHPLLAVQTNNKAHTSVSAVHYSNFGRDFVAVSGFSCSKSLQLTAYLCSSTENAFRNFWDEM